MSFPSDLLLGRYFYYTAHITIEDFHSISEGILDIPDSYHPIIDKLI